jgi:hypothetical protein
MRSTMRFSRWLLPVLVVAFEAAPARAQPRVTTLDELQHELAPGDQISLVQTTGEALTGRLLRFGDRDLDVRIVLPPATGQPRRQLDVTIPLTAIQSLERPRDSSRNGIVIGAGVGAGFVGTMFVRAIAVDRNEIDEWGPIYLGYGVLFTGVGALVGWAIDAGHSKPPVRFKKPSAETTTISLVPLLSSRGRGMALAVSF